MSDQVSDLEVEQLALGELDPERAELVRARLDEAGDERLDAIAKSNEEVLGDYPPETMGASIRKRLEREAEEAEGSPFRWMWIPAVAAVAAAVLIFALRSESVDTVQRSLDGTPVAELQLPQNDSSGLEPTRLKGDARLVIQRRLGSGTESLRPEAAVAAGDQLQLSYAAAGATHGVIVSIDGAGAVTLHFPADVGASTSLVESGTVALDHSYELDDAPAFERFWLVTSAAPLSVEDVMDAARAVTHGDDPRAAPLQVPEGAQAKSVVLNKAP